jgi:hypothetical protein
VTKFAFPALILCIFALFSYSVTSQLNDAPPDLAELPAGPTEKLAEAETASQNREQSSVNAVNGFGAEVQRLSDEVRANSDKIAQTATLRSDLLKLIQESKSSSDKVAKSLLDQINATRSEQVKLLKDANEAGEKAAQALRDEVAASQAKLVGQIDAALKANTDRAQTLAQRVDVMKKDIDDLKKNIDEDRQNQSNISPGFALFAALAALALGPFLAYQLTANQLTRSKQQAAATAARTQTAKSAEVGPPLAPSTTAEDGPPLAPSTAAEPEQETSLNHEAEEAKAYQDADGPPQASTDQEKV